MKKSMAAKRAAARRRNTSLKGLSKNLRGRLDQAITRTVGTLNKGSAGRRTNGRTSVRGRTVRGRAVTVSRGRRKSVGRAAPRRQVSVRSVSARRGRVSQSRAA